ncbi:hypothetical protein VCRA2117O380_100063 [Vibrio crassostreae]|nr:hypothetical protein VCRA2117O380_100063 [Vibrio crassostreae]CAK1704127.1 hypothetical protein VCRA2117O379_100121 [Vibrio crassostreae]CAK1959022.1 hypothetical protein VCRA2119O381_290016 [Vibrio crassostreae]CAK2401759.1 hypothetical protein VCRA2113O350_110122 [Vibrio crassostreae]CAK2575417.1 hypothetical protein VCRA2119O383_100118 [Vibrio crassostreae]
MSERYLLLFKALKDKGIVNSKENSQRIAGYFCMKFSGIKR